jgi:hypothetical protein
MSQKFAAPSGTMIGSGAQPVIRHIDKISIRYLVNGMVRPLIIKNCLQPPAASGQLKLKIGNVLLKTDPVSALHASIADRGHSNGSEAASQI